MTGRGSVKDLGNQTLEVLAYVIGEVQAVTGIAGVSPALSAMREHKLEENRRR